MEHRRRALKQTAILLGVLFCATSLAHAQPLPCGSSITVTIAAPGATAASYVVPVPACVTPTTTPHPPAIGLITTDVNVGGAAGRILYPTNFNGTALLYHHGSSENRLSLEADLARAPLLHALLDAGYLIAMSDGLNTSDWGVTTGIDRHVALQQEVERRYAPTGYVVWSSSMGGLSGLTVIAQQRVPKLRGWFGHFPVTNLPAMMSNPEAAGAICTAYNLTPAEVPGTYGFNLKTEGNNPLWFSAGAFTGVPMRAYASYNDHIVPRQLHADALAVKYPQIVVMPATGDHGDASHYQIADVLTWLASIR